MLLVPRQLMRSGMTGGVPYYGGRFSPSQAYAASHPSAPTPAMKADAPPTRQPDTEAALRHLRDSGVLDAEEYAELMSRTQR
jgi:hypothetical protein